MAAKPSSDKQHKTMVKNLKRNDNKGKFALTILIHFAEAKWKETLSFEVNKFQNQSLQGFTILGDPGAVSWGERK